MGVIFLTVEGWTLNCLEKDVIPFLDGQIAILQNLLKIIAAIFPPDIVLTNMFILHTSILVKLFLHICLHFSSSMYY